jgi:flagellar hook-associated protein 2
MSLSSINRTILRMSGLSSGIDTESVVKSMLTYDQSKVDKQFQLKTTMQWRAEALREVNTLLKTFRESNMSGLKQSANMMSSAAYNAYNVTMLTDTKAVLVTAGAQAVTGSMTINEITGLAEAAAMKSSGITDTPISGGQAKLKEIDFAVPLAFDETGAISFLINGQRFDFDEDTTLNDMLSTINANAQAGVKISYSSLTEGFNISSKTTGQSSCVTIENIAGNAFGSGSAFGIAEGSISGKNAMLKIENIDVEMENNTFSIDGITYTLREKASQPIKFTIERDVEKTVDMVKNFINSYNELIGKLQAKLDEPSYTRSYPPLTDAQRESLSETEQKKWDELSRSGLLRNDRDISSFLDKLRSAFYENVAAAGKSPSALGLTTGLYSDKGKINIDEDKLRKAIENNPEEVMMLFVSTSSDTDPNVKFQKAGLVTRISDLFISYTSNAAKVTLHNLDEDIRRAEYRLSELEKSLTSKEETLWTRFTAMETAMSKLNSQSSWFSSQLGSMTNN